MKKTNCLMNSVIISALLCLWVATPLIAGTKEEIKSLKEQVLALQGGQEKMQEDLVKIIKLLEQGAKAAPGAQPPGVTFQPTDLLVGDSAFLGDIDAPVTLFEYSDYQCPFCSRHATVTLPEIVEKYVDSGKLRIVMREFPIESIHRRAFASSQAALCVGEQGKYWEMHDLIFANPKALSDDDFKSYSQTLGLDIAAFEACLDDEEISGRIRLELQEGQGLGISGTPSFVVGLTDQADSNKVRVTEYIRGAQPYSIFEKAIDGLLEEAAGAD